MARFQEPGFMTRQVQRNEARFGQAIAPHPTTSMMKPNIPGPLPRPRLGGLPSWMIKDMVRPFAPNPCMELNGLHRELCDIVPAPRKVRAKNTWEDFDTHKPQGFRTLFRDSNCYVQRLKARGWKALGSGFYSTVMGKPGSDKVIKICRNGGDDAYPMFAAWAHENPSPFLPRIHAFKRHQGFYVTVLDRLEKTVGHTHPNEGWSQTTDMLQSYCRGNEFKGMRKVMLDAVFAQLPGLKEVVDAFAKEFRGQASFDMHDNNWMLSATGQLVMTDPLAGTSTDRATERNSRVSRIKAAMRLAA